MEELRWFSYLWFFGHFVYLVLPMVGTLVAVLGVFLVITGSVDFLLRERRLPTLLEVGHGLWLLMAGSLRIGGLALLFGISVTAFFFPMHLLVFGLFAESLIPVVVGLGLFVISGPICLFFASRSERY